MDDPDTILSAFLVPKTDRYNCWRNGFTWLLQCNSILFSGVYTTKNWSFATSSFDDTRNMTVHLPLGPELSKEDEEKFLDLHIKHAMQIITTNKCNQKRAKTHTHTHTWSKTTDSTTKQTHKQQHAHRQPYIHAHYVFKRRKEIVYNQTWQLKTANSGPGPKVIAKINRKICGTNWVAKW